MGGAVTAPYEHQLTLALDHLYRQLEAAGVPSQLVVDILTGQPDKINKRSNRNLQETPTVHQWTTRIRKDILRYHPPQRADDYSDVRFVGYRGAKQKEDRVNKCSYIEIRGI
jgi:hypothetical protein